MTVIRSTGRLRAMLLASTAACCATLLGQGDALALCTGVPGSISITCGSGPGGILRYGNDGINVTVPQGSTVTSPLELNRIPGTPGPVRFTNPGTLTAFSFLGNPYSLLVQGDATNPANTFGFRNDGQFGSLVFNVGGETTVANTNAMGGINGSTSGNLIINNTGTIIYGTSGWFNSSLTAGQAQRPVTVSEFNTSVTTDPSGNRVTSVIQRTIRDVIYTPGRVSLSNAAGASFLGVNPSSSIVLQTISAIGDVSIDNAGTMTFNDITITGGRSDLFATSSNSEVVNVAGANGRSSTNSSNGSNSSTAKVHNGDVTVTNRAGGVLSFSRLTARAAAGLAGFTNEAGATVNGDARRGLVLQAGNIVTNTEGSDSLSVVVAERRRETQVKSTTASRAVATAGTANFTNAGTFASAATLAATDKATLANTGVVTGAVTLSAGGVMTDSSASSATSSIYLDDVGTSSTSSSQSRNHVRAHSGLVQVTNGQGARIGGLLSLSVPKGDVAVSNDGFIQGLQVRVGMLETLTTSSASQQESSTFPTNRSVTVVERTSRSDTVETAAASVVGISNGAAGTIGDIVLQDFATTAIVNDGLISQGIRLVGPSQAPARSGTRSSATTFRSEKSPGLFSSTESTNTSFAIASAGTSFSVTNRGTIGSADVPSSGFLSLLGDASVSLDNSGVVMEGAWLSARGSRQSGTQSLATVVQNLATVPPADSYNRKIVTHEVASTEEVFTGTVRLTNSGTLGRASAGPASAETAPGSAILEGRAAELQNAGTIKLGEIRIQGRSNATSASRRMVESTEVRLLLAGYLRTLKTVTTETKEESATTTTGAATLRNSGSVQVARNIDVLGAESASVMNSGSLSADTLFVGDRSEDTRARQTTLVVQSELEGGVPTRTSRVILAEQSRRTVASGVTVRNESPGSLTVGSILLGGANSVLENAGVVRVDSLGLIGSVQETATVHADGRLVSMTKRSLGGRATFANTGTVTGRSGGAVSSLVVAGDTEARLSNGASGSITGGTVVESLTARTSVTGSGDTAITEQARGGGLAVLQQDGSLAGPVRVLGFAQSALSNTGSLTGATTVGSIRLADYDMDRDDALFATVTVLGGSTTRRLALPSEVPPGVTLVKPSGLTAIIGNAPSALLGSAVLTNSGSITGAVGVGAYNTAYLENSGTITGDVTLLANGARILNNSGTIDGTVTIGTIPTAPTVTTPVALPATSATEAGRQLAAAMTTAGEPPVSAVVTPSPSPTGTPLLSRVTLPGLPLAGVDGMGLALPAADEAQPETVTADTAGTGAPIPLLADAGPAVPLPPLPGSLAVSPVRAPAGAIAAPAVAGAGLLTAQSRNLNTLVVSTGAITSLVAQGPATDIRLSGANARIGSLSFTAAGSTNTLAISGGATVDSLVSLTDAAGARLANTSVTWDVADSGTPMVYAGTMSGLTSFTKTGAGTLVLRGRVDATDLEITGGQLTLSGASAGITGNFAVRSGSSLMQGMGQDTLSVARAQFVTNDTNDVVVGGNFSLVEGADYRVYVQPAFSRTAILGTDGIPVGSTPFAADPAARSVQVKVGGNATLAGGMTVMLTPFALYRDGQALDLMRVEGTLSTTKLIPDLNVASPVITPVLHTRAEGTQTVVAVELDRRSYTTVTGGAANGAAVGAGLDGALTATLATLGSTPSSATAQDMANLLTAFDFGLTAAQATAVAADLDGELHASLGALDFGRAFVEAGADRLDGEAGAAGHEGTRYGGWASFTGRKDRLGERDGLSGITGNYRGVAVGLDAQTSGGLLLGLMAGRGNTELGSRGGLDDGSVGSRHFGAYAAARFGVGQSGAIRLDTQAAFTRNDIELTRQLPSLGRTATTDTEGDEVTVTGKVTYDATLNGGKTVLSPFAAAAWRHRTVDAFTEGGAGAVSLIVAKQKDSRVDGTLGLGARHSFTLGEATTLTPSVTVAYRFEGDPDATATARFVGGGADFTSLGVKRDDGVDLNLGLSLKVGPTFEAYAGYAGTLAKDERATRVNAGIRARF